MKTLMMMMLLLFSLPARGEDFGAERLRILNDKNTEFSSISTEQFDAIVKLPLGARYTETYASGEMVVNRYMGVENYKGTPTVVHWREKTIYAVDAEKVLGKDFSRTTYDIYRGEFYDGPMGENTVGPEMPFPGDGPDGGAGDCKSKGPFCGKSTTPQGLNWGNAAKGAAISGFLTGIGRSVVIPPSERRKMEKLKADFEKVLRATQQERDALVNELKAYDKQAIEAMKQAAKDWKDYEAVSLDFTDDFLAPGTGLTLGDRIRYATGKMVNFSPVTPVQGVMKDAAIASLGEAAKELHGGSAANAQKYTELAELFADSTVAFNPAASVVKDGTEFLSGRHMASQRVLTHLERGMAGVGFVAGMLSYGVGSSVVDGAQIATKVALKYGKGVVKGIDSMGEVLTLARSLGVQTVDGLKSFARYGKQILGNEFGAIGNIAQLKDRMHLGAWVDKFELFRVGGANKLNADILAKFPDFRAPYKPGTEVFDLLTKGEEKFLRLYSRRTEMAEGALREVDNMKGRWVIRAEAIDKTLTPGQLRLKYSLPFTPDAVAEVVVPKSTLMRRSKANSAFGGGEGAIQYEILDDLNFNAVKFNYLNDL